MRGSKRRGPRGIFHGRFKLLKYHSRIQEKDPPLETQYDSSDPTLKKNSESANDACAVDGMFCLIMQYSYNACFISNISWSEN